MLWHYEKASEDENTVVYAYGWNTRETTGQFVYDKNTEEVTVLKVADNDDKAGALWAASKIRELTRRGLPQKTCVQTG